MRIFLPFLFLPVLFSCHEAEPRQSSTAAIILAAKDTISWYPSVGAIVTPQGYKRIPAETNSFTAWLRAIPLKKDKIVYLFNGKIKPNQAAQFAVIDMTTGKQDLQQCADVVMRLRAEYLFAQKQYDAIAFMDYTGRWYRWSGVANRAAFDHYLQTVFGWCGSASLEKQLRTVENFRAIQPGDVLVRGGFPGHAMLVVDVAVNGSGKKLFMLAQGYQPAQDMHIVNNPLNPALSPWYLEDDASTIITPEWEFNKTQLRRW